jgi:hypothetical protein
MKKRRKKKKKKNEINKRNKTYRYFDVIVTSLLRVRDVQVDALASDNLCVESILGKEDSSTVGVVDRHGWGATLSLYLDRLAVGELHTGHGGVEHDAGLLGVGDAQRGELALDLNHTVLHVEKINRLLDVSDVHHDRLVVAHILLIIFFTKFKTKVRHKRSKTKQQTLAARVVTNKKKKKKKINQSINQ